MISGNTNLFWGPFDLTNISNINIKATVSCDNWLGVLVHVFIVPESDTNSKIVLHETKNVAASSDINCNVSAYSGNYYIVFLNEGGGRAPFYVSNIIMTLM